MCINFWLQVSSTKVVAMSMVEFVPEERPFWRQERSAVGDRGTPTSSMLLKINDFIARYQKLPDEHKTWARSVYSEKAIAEFLFQVNKIEREGFDTYLETRDAILKGALATGGDGKRDDPRLEAVCCLHRALRQWFKAEDEDKVLPKLSLGKILEAHKLLMKSTRPDIAGRLRVDGEIAFTRTSHLGVHVFMWPTEIEAAIEDLVEASNCELAKIFSETDINVRTEKLLKFGGRFFQEFENIHPFNDGNGRIGRILVATILRSVMPFPNVLFVETKREDPPFVDRMDYIECFVKAQVDQHFEETIEGGRRGLKITREAAECKLYPPVDLTAMVIEGVYVGWKRFFAAIDGCRGGKDEQRQH